MNNAGVITGSSITGAFILDNNYRERSDYGAFGVNQSGEVAGYKVGNNPYRLRSLPYSPLYLMALNGMSSILQDFIREEDARVSMLTDSS